MNFTWWVNRKDRTGSNLFEGGFLGLDNIGVFDRSAPLPTGGYLEQADGTAWMALFCQNMCEIAGQLALERPAYAEMAHEVRRALSVDRDLDDARRRRHRHVGRGGRVLLRCPPASGRPGRAAARCARWSGCCRCAPSRCSTARLLEKYPELRQRLRQFLEARPELRAFIHDPAKIGQGGRRLGAILDETKLRRVLTKMLDEAGVLQPLRHPGPVPHPRRSSVRVPRGEPGVPGVVPAGRVRHRHVRRQLQLAGADLDARQRADHPGASPVLHLLWRRVHDRMPHGLGAPDDAVPGRRGAHPPAGQHLPAGRAGPAARVRGSARSSRRTRTGATTSCSTSTSTATTGPASARATRRGGPASSPAPCICSRRAPPSSFSSAARLRGGWTWHRRRAARPRARRPAGSADMSVPEAGLLRPAGP